MSKSIPNPQPSKLELTKLFLAEAGIAECPVVLRMYMRKWWVTPHSPIGLRLTHEGHKFLSTVLKLNCYSYKIVNTPKSMRVTLRLNKYLTAPYYLSGPDTIVLYGELDASMLGLMGGELGMYLENFTR